MEEERNRSLGAEAMRCFTCHKPMIAIKKAGIIDSWSCKTKNCGFTYKIRRREEKND